MGRPFVLKTNITECATRAKRWRKETEVTIVPLTYSIAQAKIGGWGPVFEGAHLWLANGVMVTFGTVVAETLWLFIGGDWVPGTAFEDLYAMSAFGSWRYIGAWSDCKSGAFIAVKRDYDEAIEVSWTDGTDIDVLGRIEGAKHEIPIGAAIGEDGMAVLWASEYRGLMVETFELSGLRSTGRTRVELGGTLENEQPVPPYLFSSIHPSTTWPIIVPVAEAGATSVALVHADSKSILLVRPDGSVMRGRMSPGLVAGSQAIGAFIAYDESFTVRDVYAVLKSSGRVAIGSMSGTELLVSSQAFSAGRVISSGTFTCIVRDEEAQESERIEGALCWGQGLGIESVSGVYGLEADGVRLTFQVPLNPEAQFVR